MTCNFQVFLLQGIWQKWQGTVTFKRVLPSKIRFNFIKKVVRTIISYLPGTRFSTPRHSPPRVICIFTKTDDPHEHLEKLEKVLDSLRQHDLLAKGIKCSLFRTEMEFLGFLVSADGTRPTPSKVEVVGLVRSCRHLYLYYFTKYSSSSGSYCLFIFLVKIGSLF